MKRLLSVLAAVGLCSAVSLQGSSYARDDWGREIKTVVCDSAVAFIPGREYSPSCSIRIEFSYLHPASGRDAVAEVVNRELKKLVFGEEYMYERPRMAVQKTVNEYIADCRNQFNSLYDPDLYEMGWDNERKVSTELTHSCGNIYNYSVFVYHYSPGMLHQSYHMIWKNFDAVSGKVIKLEDVINDVRGWKFHELFNRYLFAELSELDGSDHYETFEELKDSGTLMCSEMFVPDNFLITDEGISFLYNPYQIACFGMGDIQFTIPYDELRPFLK